MYASTKVNPLTLECGDGQLSPDSKTKIRAAMGDWSSPSKTISYKGKSWQIRRGRDAEGLAEALYKAEELFALMNKLGIRLETSYESSEIEIRVDDVEFDYDGEALKYQCSTVIDETALRGL